MSYDITGNRHIGSAMKKKQAYLNEWKIKARRRVKPGFPINKPFETRQEIEEYLNVDRLLCLLCGKTFKALVGHLRVHAISTDQYKEQYGLPYGCGLTCISTKNILKAHGRRLVSEGIFKPMTSEEHTKMISTKKVARSKPRYAIDEGTIRISGKQKDKLFTDQHYLEILEIAEKNNWHPTDVCRSNKGILPSVSMLHKYKQDRTDYRERYDQIIEKLPAKIRMLHGKKGNDYAKEIGQLKKERKTNAEIGEILGVHEVTIEKYNKKYSLKKESPATCQSGLHPYPGLNKRCQPCVTISSRKYLGTMPRDISKTILIDRECTDCGARIKATRLYGAKKVKYCAPCGRKRYYDSQNKYAKEKRKLVGKDLKLIELEE